MNIRMSRPWLHPTTGKFYYRSRLRADVAVMAGRTVTIDVGGESCTIKLGDLVKVSLRTRDVSEARLRHASVQAQLEQHRAAQKNVEKQVWRVLLESP